MFLFTGSNHHWVIKPKIKATNIKNNISPQYKIILTNLVNNAHNFKRKFKDG